MDSPNPLPMRVLTRLSPAPVSLLTSSADPASAPATAPSRPCSQDGVVVVGFIGRRPDDSAQVINRVLDSNVFGPGNLDKSFTVDKEEVKGWFKCRRISYYHEEEKGILFLQFCSTNCPAFDGFLDPGSGFDSIVEEREFGDLQGLLFMFSVCHVVIYIQEGSRFGTQYLKNFRALQSAKHALAPYLRSRTTPPLPSRAHSSSSSRPSVLTNSSNNASLGRGGGILSRNASSISLMSGLGSYTSLFPGQCTPVTLFVFSDDFSEMSNSSSTVEESTDATSLNQSSTMSNVARPTLPMKGSGSVVVLARPASKSEGGLRKKLQSSLEAQIRFLIKKSRTLVGSESGHAGSRSGGASSSIPLFSLDATRSVVLLDRSTNQRGESLEFVSSLVEDVLNEKATSDSLLLESHSQISNKEDILSIKEFIYRQSDILRGRGGLVTNTNSGSAAGVGMVAVAAAVAAASAASGKTFTTPELPSLDLWLASSQLILLEILTAKRGCIGEAELGKRKPRQRNLISGQIEGSNSKVVEPLDIAVSYLEIGRGLNTKFSTLWCERALPDAKDVYLKDLPACYPTSVHDTHLQKALLAFNSMVRGPAVGLFTKRLEDECTSIWKSGRQLCDAVSLTGKPCMHQRHDVEKGESLLGAEVKPHSSGYVFLHACACGRSRRLRSDPFDFESANIVFNCFPDCEKLLPAICLTDVSNAGPIKPSSWSLIRIGSARYYEHSTGLLQSGFCPTQKFLLRWTIILGKQKIVNELVGLAAKESMMVSSSSNFKVESNEPADMEKTCARQLYTGDKHTGVGNNRKPFENSNAGDNKINFGSGLPNFMMRKPFSEVVAGSAIVDSAFPPLQQRKQPSTSLEKGLKQNRTRDQIMEQVHETLHRGSQNPQGISSGLETFNETINTNSSADNDPFLQIGCNVVPVNMNGGEKVRSNPVLEHVSAYVGFEHECPYGHRFLLNPEHLNQLGPSYLMLEESHIPTSAEDSFCTVDSSKVDKNAGHGRIHRKSNKMISAMNKVKNIDKTKHVVVPKGNLCVDGPIQLPCRGEEQNHTSFSVAALPHNVKDLETKLQFINLDDNGHAFSMLNRNLPIYMNCPHCKCAKKDPRMLKFAGTISQLQRIFLVTPPFPVVLGTCPVIQFERSCLPLPTPDWEEKLQFSLGYRVILPPESFLTLRLPFVYGVQQEDRSLLPLRPFEQCPEKTAWLLTGTTLQVISKGGSPGEAYQM